METKFSKFLTGFRKNHNTQYTLLRMIENWKTQLSKRNRIGAIIMDLSQEFDTLNHNLFVAKLKASGLVLNAVSFIKSCLTNRYERCKIGNSFSQQELNITRVPQRSIFGNEIVQYLQNYKRHEVDQIHSRKLLQSSTSYI